MSKFQLILLFVFGAFIVIAVMLFSFSRGSGTASATVTVWGTVPAYSFSNVINTLLNEDQSLQIRYVEKREGNFENEFTNALAEGTGPDLVILPQDMLWKQRNRLLPMPYENVSERDFKTTFIEEGELFLTQSGIYALPLFVDPLVLYWNRDLLTSAGIARPLTHWDEMYNAAAALTKRDGAGNITQSVMALGEANNIPNYKNILSLLMLQAGTPITAYAGSGDSAELRSVLSANFNLPIAPTDAALDFYTQFSNPAKVFYSWNRSLLPASTHFASGSSAYYIGFASELPLLRAKNPTLNMSVALVPQSRVSARATTFGRLYGMAIVRNNRNTGASFTAATKLISQDVALALTQSLGLPPARRDLLGDRPADAVYSVFYDAALQSRGWLDPDASATDAIFKEMIESVTSGRARVSEAVNRADREVDSLIQ